MSTLLRLHPLCCFLFFFSVMGVTIFTRDPIVLLESLVGAAVVLAVAGKFSSSAAAFAVIPLSAVINPLLSHNGATVLFFVGDVAITLESAAYGTVFGMMLAAAVMWSVCSTVFLTSDKYIWLFGRILPSAGLTLSCSLRFVPLFIRRGKEFAAAQGASSLAEYLRAYSAAIGYSAEEAMSSADSMKARGYGSAKRTSYSLYRFGSADRTALSVILLLTLSVVILLLCGAGEFSFYPVLSSFGGATDMVLYVVFGALCLLPAVAAAVEGIKRSGLN